MRTYDGKAIPAPLLRRIGVALYGADRWQERIAADLGNMRLGRPLNARTVQRWAAGQNPMPADWRADLDSLLWRASNAASHNSLGARMAIDRIRADLARLSE